MEAMKLYEECGCGVLDAKADWPAGMTPELIKVARGLARTPSLSGILAPEQLEDELAHALAHDPGIDACDTAYRLGGVGALSELAFRKLPAVLEAALQARGLNDHTIQLRIVTTEHERYKGSERVRASARVYDGQGGCRVEKAEPDPPPLIQLGDRMFGVPDAGSDIALVSTGESSRIDVNKVWKP